MSRQERKKTPAKHGTKIWSDEPTQRKKARVATTRYRDRLPCSKQVRQTEYMPACLCRRATE